MFLACQYVSVFVSVLLKIDLFILQGSRSTIKTASHCVLCPPYRTLMEME